MNDINIIEFEQKILQAKKDIDAKRPFNQIQLKNLQKWFQVWFTYNSNAIEWNSYTLEEVRLLLEDWITVWWKPLSEQKETLNHWKVVDNLWGFVDNTFDLTEKFILSLHKEIFQDVIEKKYLWVWRTIEVMITGEIKMPPSPSKVPKLMQDFIISTNKKSDNILRQIANIHYDFVKIHPFVDGNGRVARLLMNVFLLQNGFFPIIFPMIVRNEYIWSLNSTRRFEDFYKFFLWQMWENIKDYKRFFENK